MKYILKTDQWGYDAYIADEELSAGSTLTDNIKEALEFDSDFDSTTTKLSYWRAVSGLDLRIEEVSNG